ncbi:hypothetical protein JW698_02040 [Candidatus Wolfebacteria bacterium]|nr:hypothetical protein [Candidatus Wolfebacteria bacterium]
MEFPKISSLKFKDIAKFLGLILLAIIVVAVGFRLIISSFKLSSESGIKNVFLQNTAPDFDDISEEYAKSSEGYDGVAIPTALSVRNVIDSDLSKVLINTGSTGDDAEEFEVTEYNATIETRNLEKVCAEIAGLKSREDVVFENADEYEKSCRYVFKVKHGSVEKVLSIIESLNPKELNENTYTIKKLVDDYTSEIEILEKKMASIEETLKNAIRAYDDITDIATKTQDAESLAKIIDSKIGIIERLTQQKISVNAQLERLARSKAEQLDRLEYAYFSVYILENKFVDWQNLKDSWKATIKSFVRDINQIAQDITVNLVLLLFLIIQYIIYLFIILIVAKYGWKFVKYFWKK